MPGQGVGWFMVHHSWHDMAWRGMTRCLTCSLSLSLSFTVKGRWVSQGMGRDEGE